MKGLATNLLLYSLIASTALALTNDACNYKIFPTFAGGESDETMNCLTYDSTTNYIIVGGHSTSSDFAPAENQHGFVYALDLNGNWMWGNFFYNVSYAVSDVTGIQLSSAGSNLMVFGTANSKPVIMTLSKTDGSIKKFLTIEPYASSTTTPTYLTYNGFYYDEKDLQDSQQYYYVSFTKSQELHVLKFATTNNYKIQWHFSYLNSVTTLTQKPKFLSMDPAQTTEFYLIGQTDSQGSITKMQKVNGKIQYLKKFSYLTEITAYTPLPGNEHVYGCGYYTDSVPTTHAGFFRLKNDGSVKFFYSLEGSGTDKCQGIDYNSAKSQLTLIIQSDSTQLKGYSSDTGIADSAILIFSESGSYSRGKHISLKSYSQTITDQGLYTLGDYFIFGGSSLGFKTYLQTKDFSAKKDVFVMKYLFEKDANSYKCLYEADLSGINSILTSRSSSTVSHSSAQFMSTQNSYFAIYSSPYSGAFDLLDTFHIPRPCASVSQNMTISSTKTTTLDYFYGQKTSTFDMKSNNYDKISQQMNDQTEYIFQNGSSTSGFATFDKENSKIYVQTNDENLVGIQKTMIRGCDKLNNLLELNFYINVSSNAPPEFATELQTQWTLTVGDNINYKLPTYSDPEGNDAGEIYINAMENQVFPEFVTYVNSTKTINFKPDQKKYQGRTYYFSVVLKEINSDTMMNIVYMTVKISGDIYDESAIPDLRTKVYMNITSIDRVSAGVLQFTQAVDMDVITNQFSDIFTIYVYNTAKQVEEIKDFEITETDGNSTIYFQATFHEPYLYGLLNKKSDWLTIELKNTTMFIFNNSDQVMSNNVTKKRIEMQFDFRNEKMQFMRNTAIILYYVMMAIVFVQFLMLFFRNVGLLPLWTLIEYMQLIAFMPLYNFKLIPYLYDIFKPFLISHLILFEDSMFYDEMADDYFNINYTNYWLPVSKLIQSLMNIMILFLVILLINLAMWVLSIVCKHAKFGDFIGSRLSQFKFNAYIRFFMLAYFDLSFFSIMKIIEANNQTTARKVALFFSYFFFVISVVVPVFLVAILLRRADVLKVKEAKRKFNTLVLKVDKASKWRIINVGFFFGRRLLTAMLLTLPINNQYIFLQYVFILVSSHSYILYMVATKPFQTPIINGYMLANETFYSALIILIFIFSDATPQINIKVLAGIALMVSIFLLVLANLVFIIFNMIKGKEKLKEQIKQAKKKRQEDEEKERKEEEERRAKKKKEEEEFTKIPDDTNNNMSVDINNTTHNNNTTISELNIKGKKLAKGKKKVEDPVDEQGYDNVKMGKKTNGYSDNVHGSDEKFKATESGPGSSYNKAKHNQDYVTKGKVSDDKMSRSSHSLDSENDGKVIR